MTVFNQLRAMTFVRLIYKSKAVRVKLTDGTEFSLWSVDNKLGDARFVLTAREMASYQIDIVSVDTITIETSSEVNWDLGRNAWCDIMIYVFDTLYGNNIRVGHPPPVGALVPPKGIPGKVTIG